MESSNFRKATELTQLAEFTGVPTEALELTAVVDSKMVTETKQVTEFREVAELRSVAELERHMELALEPVSSAGATQQHLRFQHQHQNEQKQQQQQPEPNTQPKKLNAMETIIEIAEVDANTSDQTETHNAATKNPTSPLLTTPQCSSSERTISDAAIVLRVSSYSNTGNCNKTDLGALCAQLQATTLPSAIPACRWSTVATVIPETLATSQSTCRTVCSKQQITRQRVQAEVEMAEKLYLADAAAAAPHCCPPPLFIVLVSLLEIAVFIYDYMTVHLTTTIAAVEAKTRGMSLTDISSFNNEPFIVSESSLIYRPDRRWQLWRYVSYMLLHANCYHLSFNVLVQLVYGLPLEWVHGSARIAIIYLAGVFAGSLGTSVVDSGVCLVGASGGVYALLAAYLANILLNFGQMRNGGAQLGRLGVFVSCDLCYTLYTKYHNNNNNNDNNNSALHTMTREPLPTISYIAHLCGALAGFTMGCLVLRHFDTTQASQPKLLWWLALGVYAAFMLFAIAFNLINTVTAQMLEEEESGEVVKQRLLHNLGIS